MAKRTLLKQFLVSEAMVNFTFLLLLVAVARGKNDHVPLLCDVKLFLVTTDLLIGTLTDLHTSFLGHSMTSIPTRTMIPLAIGTKA